MNRQIVLARRPEGAPKPADFRIVTTEMPRPKDGEFLVRSHFVSVDPLSRVRMKDSSTYGGTIPIDGVVWGRVVGEIVDSRNSDFSVGEFVEGMLGWQEYAISDGSSARAAYAPGVSKVDPSLAPISTSLGILGMPGVTAYFAMLELGQPKAGETVVVSAAAGTVGSLAAQIARVKGCRVIGIAGSDEKVAHLVDDLGLDGALNYKDRDGFAAAMDRLCPEGIDVYFDNVGGWIRDEMLTRLRRGARVPLVGRIADMNETAPRCPDPQEALMHARARMEGFVVYDYEHRMAEAQRAIAGWLREGAITYRETVVDGFERVPQAFCDLFTGENVGKSLVRLVA